MVSVISDIVRLALAEDAPWGDATSELLVPADVTFTAEMVAREAGVMSGGAVAVEVFRQVDPTCSVAIQVGDGEIFEAGAVLATFNGSARSILRAERVVLNLVQRLAGIATITAQYVDAVAHTGARIVDTRKTTPGLRLLEKQAVVHGGGHNHRFSLSDGILVKDNHVAAIGGLAGLDDLRQHVSHVMHVEIEVDDLTQIPAALAAGADSVLLDNFSLADLRTAVEMIGDDAFTNASGGVNLATVREVAECGVDLISVGALTHSVRSIDIGLDASD